MTTDDLSDLLQAAQINAQVYLVLPGEPALQFEIAESQQGPSSEKLKGLTFVISGVFNRFNRDQLKELIELNGGKNSGSISGKTSFLLAGENMGPEKLKKAQSLGVKIISEEDFATMLGI